MERRLRSSLRGCNQPTLCARPLLIEKVQFKIDSIGRPVNTNAQKTIVSVSEASRLDISGNWTGKPCWPSPMMLPSSDPSEHRLRHLEMVCKDQGRGNGRSRPSFYRGSIVIAGSSLVAFLSATPIKLELPILASPRFRSSDRLDTDA